MIQVCSVVFGHAKRFLNKSDDTAYIGFVWMSDSQKQKLAHADALAYKGDALLCQHILDLGLTQVIVMCGSDNARMLYGAGFQFFQKTEHIATAIAVIPAGYDK